MYFRYYLVYANDPQLVGTTPIPEYFRKHHGDREQCGDFYVGDLPFPHWLAADLTGQIRNALQDLPPKGDHRRTLERLVRRRLSRWGRHADFSWERLGREPRADTGESGALLDAVSGRILLASEIGRMLKFKGSSTELEETLAVLAATGRLDCFPAIEIMHFGRAICRRCGETHIEREECWFCGDPACWVCPSCRQFGLATGCRSLYALADVRPRSAPAIWKPVLPFSLTPAQQKAAASLTSFLRDGSSGEFLLWAVCGAGKTEVIMSGLAESLGAGARILIATPRRDVAAELSLRFTSAFPDMPTSVHFGGRHEDQTGGPMVTIATTHQCLRFYQAFDLVVLDEVDAFPYQGNRMLYMAVERARKPLGSLVFLTATPPSALTERAQAGTLPYERLPVRPHGYPLPVPELIVLGLDDAGGVWRPPDRLAQILTTCDSGRPWLIFAPTVDLVRRLGGAFAAWALARQCRAAYIHAADPERDAKRKAFAEGRLEYLVTTTILERGLTLGAINVCVLYADREEIFDTASLIQIAGRAGRRVTDPRGRVVFVGQCLTRAMRMSRAEIISANEEAVRNGFIKNPVM